jgi:hypothetical protein
MENRFGRERTDRTPFSNVPFGTYTVKVSAAYFKSASLSGQTFNSTNASVPTIKLTDTTQTYTGTVKDKKSGNAIAGAIVVVLDSNQTSKRIRTGSSRCLTFHKAQHTP